MFRAPIGANALLGSWIEEPGLLVGRYAHAGLVVGNRIYVTGGSGTTPESSVEWVEVNSDGSLGNWKFTSSLNSFRRHHGLAATSNNLYAIGGQDYVSWSISSVETAQIQSDGSLGIWSNSSALNVSRIDLTVANIDDYIIAVGGGNGRDSMYETIERTKVFSDGTLGQWEMIPIELSAPRITHGMAITNDAVYVLGGISYSGERITRVEFSQINPTCLYPDWGVSINNGALFTNTIDVSLNVGAKTAAEIQISNDGGFAGAQWEPYTCKKSWQITSYGNYVIPRVVYVRYKKLDGTISATYQDDIILDVTPPQGSAQIINTSGHLSSIDPGLNYLENVAIGDQKVFLPLIQKPIQGTLVKLKLAATDDVSGVGQMMISNNVDFSEGQWEIYKTQKDWGMTGSSIYVKFKDNAGNVSQIYSASNP